MSDEKSYYSISQKVMQNKLKSIEKYWILHLTNMTKRGLIYLSLIVPKSKWKLAEIW